MIPTQTMTAFPVFSDNGTKLQPDESKYSAGFAEADVLPYQWVNWFLNTASDAITKINSGVQSVEVELNNILTEAGKTPSALTTTQVLDSIVSIITTKITKNLTIKDADETNAGATVAFTSGGNIVLKLPATIKATLTGSASSATNSSQFDSKTPAQFRTYMSKVVDTVTGSQSIVPVYDGKYYLNSATTFILTIADGTENGVTIELRNISGVKHTLQGKIGGTSSVQKDLSAGKTATLEWVGDKWLSKEQALFDIQHPVGSPYQQYPGTASPNDMWSDYSTWEELNLYGAFFRTTGGNALDFEKKATITSVSGTTLTMASAYADVKVGCILFDPVGNESHFVYYVNGTTITVDSAFTNTSLSELIIGQEDSLLEHEHYVRYFVAAGGGSSHEGAGPNTRKPAKYLGIADGRFNTNENRAVNFTTKLWKRVS